MRVADALQGWIKDGLCYGPLEEHELPWDDVTVIPITVKLKPNGKARICIDMSAPYIDTKSGETVPSSVNSGIDTDEFPTSMSSTKSFCESLMKAGCPGEMCKIDWNQVRLGIFSSNISICCFWNQAYKHLAVREEDHKLQVLSFGGKFFGEVMLTFGCTSSAGHFDDTAKLVKNMAEKASNMDKSMVIQVLDDVVACGAEGDGTVARFYKAYRDICNEVGISLAD